MPPSRAVFTRDIPRLERLGSRVSVKSPAQTPVWLGRGCERHSVFIRAVPWASKAAPLGIMGWTLDAHTLHFSWLIRRKLDTDTTCALYLGLLFVWFQLWLSIFFFFLQTVSLWSGRRWVDEWEWVKGRASLEWVPYSWSVLGQFPVNGHIFVIRMSRDNWKHKSENTTVQSEHGCDIIIRITRILKCTTSGNIFSPLMFCHPQAWLLCCVSSLNNFKWD